MTFGRYDWDLGNVFLLTLVRISVGIDALGTHRWWFIIVFSIVSTHAMLAFSRCFSAVLVTIVERNTSSTTRNSMLVRIVLVGIFNRQIFLHRSRCFVTVLDLYRFGNFSQ